MTARPGTCDPSEGFDVVIRDRLSLKNGVFSRDSRFAATSNSSVTFGTDQDSGRGVPVHAPVVAVGVPC
ncbi:hypothetical protein GCM10023075_78160 [Streptosporangium album]